MPRPRRGADECPFACGQGERNPAGAGPLGKTDPTGAAMKADATEPRTITIYIDYKSPYAYLAKDLVYELERDFPVRIDWLPYRLDIPSFLGSARLDDNGRMIEEQRNAHQWRRVRYSYMDCRRQARKRGLVVRLSGVRPIPRAAAFL